MSRTYGHLSVRYLWDRVMQECYARLHPEWPWMNRHAVHLLEQLSRPADRVLEFGAGRSSIWWAQRVASVTAIEHDNEWAKWVSHRAVKTGVSDRLDIVSVAGEGSRPDRTIYNSKISLLCSSETFDIVVVDGIFRSMSALMSLQAVRPNGIIVIDDSNRHLTSGRTRSPALDHRLGKREGNEWVSFQAETQEWRSVTTSDGITDCLILINSQGVPHAN